MDRENVHACLIVACERISAHTCTHIHIRICVVENGSLKDKTSSTLTATEKCKFTSRGTFINKKIFFCKCNAKNSDTHDVSLHTGDECIGGR